MKFIFNNGEIEKLALALPAKKVNFINERYESLDDAQQQMHARVIGLGTRYIAEHETTLDLCETAAQKIIDDPQSIDALIFVTQTPDYFSPGNSFVLHGRLGLKKECCCIDINAGCTGYVLGLWQSYLMMQQPGINRVLLCVGDTFSKAVNPYDSATAPLFGDGGSATLLKRKENTKSWFSLGSDGQKFDKLIIQSGAFRNPGKENNFLFMDGIEVMRMTITEIPGTVNELINYAGISKEEIDHFFFHQANKMIVETLAGNLKVPKEKVPVVFHEYGNQSSASIPFAIEGRKSALRNTQGEKSEIKDLGLSLLCGFGVGFSWANAIIDLSNTSVIS